MDTKTSRPFDFPITTGKSKNLEVSLITSSEGHWIFRTRQNSNERERPERVESGRRL